MTTLFDSRLSDRDFASRLLNVVELLAWATSKRLHLRTQPQIDGYEFVQVEALLAAIQRQANDLTLEQALAVVLNDPVLKNDSVFKKYPDDVDPLTCRWLIGAEAHRKWRELLSGAIAAQELTLLDFGSKLPTDNASAPVNTTTKSREVCDWRNAVRAEAWEQWVKILAENGTPTLQNVSEYLAAWCAQMNIRTDTDRTPQASYIKTHVICAKYWVPPRAMSREAAKKHLAEKKHEKQGD